MAGFKVITEVKPNVSRKPSESLCAWSTGPDNSREIQTRQGNRRRYPTYGLKHLVRGPSLLHLSAAPCFGVKKHCFLGIVKNILFRINSLRPSRARLGHTTGLCNSWAHTAEEAHGQGPGSPGVDKEHGGHAASTVQATMNHAEVGCGSTLSRTTLAFPLGDGHSLFVGNESQSFLKRRFIAAERSCQIHPRRLWTCTKCARGNQRNWKCLVFKHRF